jgi:murein DD-endopeptidase MepM/ murein hydrolase activator NlpD
VLSPARVIGGRVRAVCRACAEASWDELTDPLRQAATPIDLPALATGSTERRARVTGGRLVALTCAIAAGAAVAIAATPEGGDESPVRVAAALVPQQRAAAPAEVSLGEPIDGPDPIVDVVEPDDDRPPPIGDPEELDENGDEPLPVRFPTLADWVHPVIGAREPLPIRASREFGAERDGDRPPECGGGHCGVDLAGPRGTAVVAVAWGVVERVIDDPDRPSGRYVRITHPEGGETSYMHLDEIADGLHRGDEVEPGQLLGTLGKSGILHAPAHLHFALSLPLRGQRTYVDPVPYLQTAQVVHRPNDL